MKTAALDLLSRFVMRPGQWDAEAEAWARRIPCDSPGDLTARLASLVLRGDAKVCDLITDGARVGYIVFSPTAEHELIVHAAFGRDLTANLMDSFLPHVYALARACECQTVRFHTMRAGLISRAQQHGFHVSEVIMRKSL